MPANKNQTPFGIVGKRSARSSYAARSNPVFSVFAERRGSRACANCDKTSREAEAEATPMFLLPRPRRDLPFVLAPMSRRLSPRETAPPRRRRRDQPRPSSERCRAATMRRRRLFSKNNFFS